MCHAYKTLLFELGIKIYIYFQFFFMYVYIKFDLIKKYMDHV